jgi:hypothetical protein
MEWTSTYNPNEIGRRRHEQSDEEEEVKLRISKSSFMLARQCRRKYWWNKVQFPDLWMPPTEAMIRGNVVHSALEKMYDSYDGHEKVETLFPRGQYDDTIDAIISLEQQRLDAWGAENFKPISYETKETVYDEEFDVVMVGAWDGLIKHPDGGLCLVELKTGDLSTAKLSRVRRELCFYARMIDLMGKYEEPITHIMLISSDCTNDRTAQSLLKQKAKEVYLGEEKGITVIEKLGKRSRDAFMRDYTSVVADLKAGDWSPSWSEYFCSHYCDFHLSCDDELHGIGEDPTVVKE